MSRSSRSANTSAKPRSLARRAGLAVAAIALGASLAGCQGGNPGAAAFVNGGEITEMQVTQAVKDWESLTGQAVGRADMALALTQGRAYRDAAAELGISYDPTEMDARIDELLQSVQLPLTTADLSDAGRQVLGLTVIMADVQEQGLEQDLLVLAEQAEIKVNPRYGSLVDGQFVPPGPVGDGFTLGVPSF